MAIRVTCACGKSLRARDELAGKRVKCPQCGQVSRLPVLVAPAPPPAAARPHKVLLPDGRVEKVRDTPEKASGPGELPPSYRIDLGAWCRTANEHYSAVLGPMIGYLLLLLLIVAALMLLSLVLIGYVGFILLLPPLAAGPTIVCLMQLRGRKWAFGDFFAGFRRYGTWLALELLAGLILVAGFLPGLLVGALAGAASYALRLDPNSPVMMVPGIICYLVVLAGYLAGVYVWFRAGIFARQLVIDRGCGAIDALKGSWRLTRGHFWGLFGTFLLVLLGVEVFSLLTCGIGMLFALPYGLLVLNAGYLHITGTRHNPGGHEPDDSDQARKSRPASSHEAPSPLPALLRRRWPWVAGGAGVACLLVVGLVCWLWRSPPEDDAGSGPIRVTKVLRARTALLGDGRRLNVNSPDRDIVVVLKIKGVPRESHGGELAFDSYVTAGAERRDFNSMSIPDDGRRPIWAAAVIPREAKTLTLNLHGLPSLTVDLPGTIVDEARAFD